MHNLKCPSCSVEYQVGLQFILDLLLFAPQETWSLSPWLNLFMFDDAVPIYSLLCISMTVPGLFIHVHIKYD